MSTYTSAPKQLESTLEEVKIMVDAFWEREMAIIQLKLAGQQPEQSAQQIKGCISDVRYKDRIQREQEQRVIGKYFSVKTDLQFQRFLTLRVLEGLLLNFRQAIVKYEEHKLFGEIQYLRRDVEQLKHEIQEVMQESKNNVSQTLTFLARFSRQRIDLHLQMLETSLLRQVKKDEMKEAGRESPPLQQRHTDHQSQPPQQQVPKFKIFTKIELKQSQPSPSIQQELIKPTASDTKFDLIELDSLKNNPQYFKKTNSIFTYYQNIFKTHNSRQQATMKSMDIHTPVQFKLVTNCESTERSKEVVTSIQQSKGLPTQDRPLSQFTIKTKHSQSINHTRTNATPMGLPAPEPTLKYERYRHTQQYAESLQPMPQQYSDIEPHGFLQYRQSRDEMKNLSDQDQKCYLLRFYKDQLRQNSAIQQGIDSFRRGYLTFLQKNQTSLKVSSSDNYGKHRKRTLKENSDNKCLWVELYQNLKDKKSVTTKAVSLDYKEINQMYRVAFPSKHQPDPDHSKSPANRPKELRIKTEYQLSIIRPQTTQIKPKNRTEYSDIVKNDQSFKPGEQQYSAKLKTNVQPLRFSQYDYFNL